MIDKYTYRIQWSEEDQVYISRCVEFPGILAHGTTQEKALQECKVAVQAAVDTLKEEKKPIPEPISIKSFPESYPLRLPDDVRRDLETEATEKSISLNQLITKKLIS